MSPEPALSSLPSTPPGRRQSVRFSAEDTVYVFDPTTAACTTPPSAIPKPPGQVTRIRRGGYKLVDKLGWDKNRYRAAQEKIHELAKKYLDLRLPYSDQDPVRLQKLCDEAREALPDVQIYEDDWHFKDFLIVRMEQPTNRKQGAMRCEVPDRPIDKTAPFGPCGSCDEVPPTVFRWNVVVR
ncbi:hypothetical protein AURDEDRAFT_166428 [Auricularia subglabra TFB-10046 SS5]|uniref:Uncharacterized protein n=1 Tax=Auricularia subglabra (strain TFB-10046 / SS5) TaxID=717982 RepID=J0DDX0_AURST|nr:hypothetical protein AURDEDRAFT_166428 [Auricularia subglabra TFB-10046 SS5]